MSFLYLLLALPLLSFGQEFDSFYWKRSDTYTTKVEKVVLTDIHEGKLIGCKFQNICPKERSCYDDLLFGTCIKDGDQADFIYELSPELEKILEIAMKDLFDEQFRWKDFYTQCFLKSVIKSSELSQYLDIRHCKRSVKKNNNMNDDDKSMDVVDYNRGKEKSDEFYNKMKMILVNQNNQNSVGKNEEKMNPLANSDQAVSTTTSDYEDPKIIRKELNIAKRKKSDWIWIKFNKNISDYEKSDIIRQINDALKFPDVIKDYKLSADHQILMFKLPVNDHIMPDNITSYLNSHRNLIPNMVIKESGTGHRTSDILAQSLGLKNEKSFIVTFTICCVIFLLILMGLIGFCVQKFRHRRDKLGDIINSKPTDQPTTNYVDLFRSSNRETSSSQKSKQILNSKVPTAGLKQQNGGTNVGGTSSGGPEVSSPISTRSSTSSWTDDAPQTTNMDIYTGHMILSYMEKHLKNREMFQSEWNSIKDYEAEDNNTTVALDKNNSTKNRDLKKVPYDKTRVVLKDSSKSDYINASYIVDHDPKVPMYIATQSPLKETINEFWQMIWEQGIVVIVNLTGIEETEDYWPTEGSETFNQYEINLVSEHMWSDEYLVRNFYLKSLQTGETRTVTQFHYMHWPHDKVPVSSRSILEFRRKVNKSYRSKSTPILIHCSDGCGRTGTYILLDLILNRIGKGMKEMDITATLEHLRDQRMKLVYTEEQFGFVLNTISEEVNTILKLLNN